MPAFKSTTPLELSDAELMEPLSVHDDGTIATVRDMIAGEAPDIKRKLFNLEKSDHTVVPINKLDIASLVNLTVAVIRSGPANRRMPGEGDVTYGLNEMMKEVEAKSDVGYRIINAVRLHGVFVEKAIKSGDIVPTNASRRIRFPTPGC